MAVRLTSFPPVVGPDPRVLILGSMPGKRSLELNQYYGHPRNLFWPIMHRLCNIDHQLPYAERIARLAQARIALWDVLQHCEREGSLDANIVLDTEVPNDFQSFLAQYTSLRAICFNGQKAAQAFARLVAPSLEDRILQGLDRITLPSTSPANASKPLHQKLAQWQRILHYLPPLDNKQDAHA